MTYSLTVIDLSSRYRRVISFTFLPLYSPPVKSSQYPLDERLNRPQNRSGRCRVEKYFAPAGNWDTAVQPVARNYID
jgi:hypothetical protein